MAGKDKGLNGADTSRADESPVIDASARFKPVAPDLGQDGSLADMTHSLPGLDEVTETTPNPSSRLAAVNDLRNLVLGEELSRIPNDHALEIFKEFYLGAIKNKASEYINITAEKQNISLTKFRSLDSKE